MHYFSRIFILAVVLFGSAFVSLSPVQAEENVEEQFVQELEKEFKENNMMGCDTVMYHTRSNVAYIVSSTCHTFETKIEGETLLNYLPMQQAYILFERIFLAQGYFPVEAMRKNEATHMLSQVQNKKQVCTLRSTLSEGDVEIRFSCSRPFDIPTYEMEQIAQQIPSQPYAQVLDLIGSEGAMRLYELAPVYGSNSDMYKYIFFKKTQGGTWKYVYSERVDTLDCSSLDTYGISPYIFPISHVCRAIPGYAYSTDTAKNMVSLLRHTLSSGKETLTPIEQRDLAWSTEGHLSYLDGYTAYRSYTNEFSLLSNKRLRKKVQNKIQQLNQKIERVLYQKGFKPLSSVTPRMVGPIMLAKDWVRGTMVCTSYWYVGDMDRGFFDAYFHCSDALSRYQKLEKKYASALKELQNFIFEDGTLLQADYFRLRYDRDGIAFVTFYEGRPNEGSAILKEQGGQYHIISIAHSPTERYHSCERMKEYGVPEQVYGECK